MSDPFQQSVSILVVEDDPGDFGLVRAHLRRAGHKRLDDRHAYDKDAVIWAKTLAEGLTLARSDRPDVALLDLTLPDSSGLATVRAMRAAMPEVPLVVLTGQDDDELALAALQAGAQDYLVKGQFEHDALGRAVRHALVRARLEAQLRESQKMEAIGMLAGGIARDFNNAIATILGNVDLARQDMGASPLALESLEEIRKAGARARDLVQQILVFSSKQPTERKPMALGATVEATAQLLRATLPARLTLEVSCDEDVPQVLADTAQITRALVNLATNAMQARHEGPGRIVIRLDAVVLDAAYAEAHPALHAMHAKHPGRTARLALSDDGPGMNAATLARIFEPFFTTRLGDQATGLGLPVVRGIVLAHEGAITVDSAPGEGTRFTLYLPAAETQRADPAGAGAAPAAAAATASGERHILYIDDDESLVFLMRRLLERRGFRVSGHIRQSEALDALRADPQRFCLAVTDYNMPGMSGLDVARAVRAIRPDLPVVVASGFIDDELRAKASAAGVMELIFKADAVEDLCDAFARLAQTAANSP